jgi:hypothetical protein
LNTFPEEEAEEARKEFLKAELMKLQGIIDVNEGKNPEFQIFWFLQGACPAWGDYHIYQKQPRWVIREALEHISDNFNKGKQISVLESMMTRAALRASGADI